MYNIQNEHKGSIFHHIDLYNLEKHPKNSCTLNTLNYFCFFIPKSDLYLNIQGIEYRILRNTITLIKPSTRILVSNYNKVTGNLYLLAFSSSFYKRCLKGDLYKKMNFYINFSCPILILPNTVYLQQIGEIFIRKLLLLKNIENRKIYQQVLSNCIEALLIELIGNFPDCLTFNKN